MTDRPHTVHVRSSDDRTLASALLKLPMVLGVDLASTGLTVRARTTSLAHGPHRFSHKAGLTLYEVTAADESWSMSSPTWWHDDGRHDTAERDTRKPRAEVRAAAARPDGDSSRGSARVSFVASRWRACWLSWARTFTPVLLLSIGGMVVLPMLFGAILSSRAGPDADPVAFLGSATTSWCAHSPRRSSRCCSARARSAREGGGRNELVPGQTTTPRWWIGTVRISSRRVLTARVGDVVAVTGLLVNGTTDPMGVTRAFTIATAFGGATYAALFTALSLLTRRALVAGLAYVLFWEGILSTTFPGIHYLSVRQWMLAVANHLTEASSDRLESGPSATASVIGAVVCWWCGVREQRKLVGRGWSAYT